MLYILFEEEDNSMNVPDLKTNVPYRFRTKKNDETSKKFLNDNNACSQSQALFKYREALRFAQSTTQVRAKDQIHYIYTPSNEQ